MKTLTFLVVFLTAGCGPVPGGKLSGIVMEVPESWQEILADNQICEIESRPNNPHSVQVECFLYQEDLYVQSHRYVNASWWPTKSWALIWQQNPEVTVRLQESLFLMHAIKVTDPALRETVLKLRGYDPVPEGIVLFRLEKPKHGSHLENTFPPI